MTRKEKIDIFESVMGSYDSWTSQLKRLEREGDIIFNHVYNTMVTSAVSNMRKQIYNLEYKIRILESTLNEKE